MVKHNGFKILSGQVQIKDYNHLTLLDKYQKKLECQVKDWYMQEHFAIKTNYNETEALQAYLYTDLYSTSLKDCELYDFVDKSIRGALGDENIDIVDLKTMQVKYRDINNYYYSTANQENVKDSNDVDIIENILQRHEYITNQFIATYNQTKFTTTNIITKIISFLRNGVEININSYTFSGTNVFYVPIENGNQVIKNNDLIVIKYH